MRPFSLPANKTAVALFNTGRFKNRRPKTAACEILGILRDGLQRSPDLPALVQARLETIAGPAFAFSQAPDPHFEDTIVPARNGFCSYIIWCKIVNSSTQPAIQH